tara:strand:- start:7199 stop:7660 length:462 start_codon:yes stop_codon:yes gene_type:complete
MTNSWAMLHEEMEEMRNRGYEMTADGFWAGREHFTSEELGEVVVTDTAKDITFWKYDEGKILREVEAYLSSTYNGHYVGEESKVQTLDLIDSIGDAEAFCRSNAIKYLSRFGKKDGKNPKDLLKVIHYAFLLYHFSDLPFTEDAVETFSPTGR